MFPHENLFVGDLGKTEQPLASRFMTTPVTREVKWGDIAYSVGATLIGESEVLACSLNGLLVMAGDDDWFDVFSLRFDPVSGRLTTANGISRSRDYSHFGRVRKDELVARGIDWIMTQRYMFRVMEDGSIRDLPSRISLGAVYLTSGADRVILCTPHRNRAFSKGIPGGGYNPFTGEATNGVIYGRNVEYFTKISHQLNEHGGQLCDWPQTVASFGDNILVDGFVIETLTDISHYDELNSLTAYHYMFYGRRPVTPLEFYADGTEGRPVYAPDYRVVSAKGQLYARGMLTMGEACLIPAAFGEAGYPTEYFLYIANSHGYQGPYSPFANTVLEKDVVWENTQPMLLKDVNDPEQNFLAGLVTQRASPTHRSICPMPTREGILLPDVERYGIGQDVFYDPTSRTGLMLDERGAMFFGGDRDNKTIARWDEYECATMADWLAPAREMESLSPKHVISSFHRGILATNIERDFARDCLKGIELGLSWGVFEKKQDENDPDKVTGRVRVSLGLLGREIVAVEMSVPDDVESRPFEEISLDDAIKNPFRLKVLDCDIKSPWDGVNDDCVLYRVVPETNEIIYGIINPETGAITETNSPPDGPPEGWEKEGQSKICGLKPNGVVYPFPSVGSIVHYSTAKHDRSDFTLSYGSNGMTAIVESSSGSRVAWRHSAFGRVILHSDGTYHDEGLTEMVRSVSGAADFHDFTEENRLNVILNNAPLPAQYSTMKHLGADPVTDWRGDRKFLKTLTVWVVRGDLVPTDYMRKYLCIMRTDLDRNVFDFDAEMEKVKN